MPHEEHKEKREKKEEGRKERSVCLGIEQKVKSSSLFFEVVSYSLN